MRLKDFTELTPNYNGQPIDGNVSFVPMESLRNGEIDLKEIPFSQAAGKYTFFANGDLLIAKVTPCFENGNIAIANDLLNGVGFGSSEIFVLRVNKKKALNTYMFYVSETEDFQGKACATMHGVGGLKRIDPLFMRTYEFNLPPLEVQQRIVSYLDDKTAEIDKAVSLLQKKRDAYTRLKASIINRAITRGLNPNVKLKDSGVDWIGMIPEGWDLIPLKGNIKLMKGRTPSELIFEKEDLPYLTMDYLRGRSDKSVMYPINSDGLIPINSNEVLVLWDGANAGEFMLSKKGYLGSTMAMISVNERKYSKNYFFYLLKSIELTSKYFANGTTIPHFSPDIFYGRCYPCPPLSEQQAIASYLDTHCSRIDHAISIVDKQIDAYTRLKKSLINEVVTGKRKC